MSPKAVTVFYAIRIPFAILLPVGFLVLGPSLFEPMPMPKTMLIAAICGLVGLYLPNYWLSKKRKSRQTKIGYGFPDALDMLVVCTEAGLGLDAAFQRVGSQIARAHPELAEQIAWVSLEMRAGKSRQDALRNMSKRIGLPEIQSFVVLLIQSDALGASIARTLRVNSDEMRVKRMMKAEEKAYALPVKLSVPLVMFILPSMITVVLLPGIIAIVRNLLPALAGGG
jgi:tight adherence protein C